MSAFVGFSMYGRSGGNSGLGNFAFDAEIDFTS